MATPLVFGLLTAHRCDAAWWKPYALFAAGLLTAAEVDDAVLVMEAHAWAAAAHVLDASVLVTVWRRSHHSNPSGECVELGPLADGVTIAVRNSRDPLGPALLFDGETICSFIDAAGDGRLDWVLEDRSRYQQVDGGTAIRGGSGESGPGA